MSPLLFDNGWTDRNADCCINSTHRWKWLRILWREMATSWHTPPLLFVLAFYNGWEYRNVDFCANIHDDSSTSDKNFVNMVLLLVCMSGWVHTWTNYARFRCFHRTVWIDLRQTFRKYGGVSRLLNKRFWLRRLAQRTLLQ